MPEPTDSQYYTPNEALEKIEAVGIKTTLATLLSWVDRNKLGFQPGGNGAKWYIHRDKFDAFIQGKLEKSHGKNENP